MRVLVFNAGSNSLKFDLIETQNGQRWPSQGRTLHSAIVEGIGGGEAKLEWRGGSREAQALGPVADFGSAASAGLEALRERAGGSLAPDITAHRVVHGGDEFDAPALITEDVIRSIERWGELAPLHNERAAAVIRAVRESQGSAPAVAVFDTAFHSRLPVEAYTYAIDPQIAEDLRIRRYGFHGISHHYQLLRYAELTGRDPREVKLVTMHLESGSSVAAIRGGHSVETSMGLTPLEGLVMGTRCGDIDPAAVGYIAKHKGMDASAVTELLNRGSGLKALSGISGDTRVLMKHIDDPRSRHALEVYSHRLRKYVGAYLAVLGGAGAIVFSGGIGENTPFVRERVFAGVAWCGIDVDEQRNKEVLEGDTCLSRDNSRVAAWVLHSDESLMIAHESAAAAR